MHMIGQICDFLKYECTVLKSDLEKSWFCPIMGQFDPLQSKLWHPWHGLFSMNDDLELRHTLGPGVVVKHVSW